MAERGWPAFYTNRERVVFALQYAPVYAHTGSLVRFEADSSVSGQKTNNPDPSQGCHGSARGLLEIWSAFSNLRGANS